jgi:hypothetical protein
MSSHSASVFSLFDRPAKLAAERNNNRVNNRTCLIGWADA